MRPIFSIKLLVAAVGSLALPGGSFSGNRTSSDRGLGHGQMKVLAPMRPYHPTGLEVRDLERYATSRTAGSKRHERSQGVIEGENKKVNGIKEEEVNERMYSQTELIGVPKAKRALLNWIKQMDYSGPTFFDG